MNLKKLFLTMFIALSSVMSMMAYTVTVYGGPGTVTETVDGPFTNFTVVPGDGYEFDYWAPRNISLPNVHANPLSLFSDELTETVMLYAMLKKKPVEQVQLTVMTVANKYGTVTGSGTYEVGDEVTITATPKEGCMFTGWDDDNEELERTITVSSSKTFYIANFQEIAKYTIDANSNNPTAGTVTGTGVYLSGSDVHMVATPNTGYYFAYWSDGLYPADRTVQATSNKTYTATFLKLLKLEVVPDADEAGSTTGDATGLKPGDKVTIEAHPNTGYVFVEWDDHETTNPRVVEMGDENVKLMAKFREVRYTLTLGVNDGAMGSVIGTAGDYKAGMAVNISASANAGYEFVGWSDGVTTATRTITMDGNKNLTAVFASLQETLASWTAAQVGMMRTTCLPSDVEAGNYKGATFYKIAYKVLNDNGVVTNLFFDEVAEDETLQAGMPYVYVPKEGFTQLTVSYTAGTKTSTPLNYHGLYGTIDGITLADSELLEGNYMVYANNTLQKCGKNCTLGAKRAYIVLYGEGCVPTQAEYEAEMGGASAPRRVSLTLDEANVATAMENLNVEKAQKVMIDGQVYIQREGQLYNVNGQLVK